MIRNAVIRWFINAAALWVVDALFDSIWFDDTGALLLTAIVFGLLNTIIKPVLILFTLPINVLTLGLFTIVINAIILKLTDCWMDSFHLEGFGIALIAAVFVSIISIALQSILKDDKK